MHIGTCSICGGPVESDMEGVGHCQRCGATESRPYGKTIQMNPPPEKEPASGSYQFPMPDWMKQ